MSEDIDPTEDGKEAEQRRLALLEKEVEEEINGGEAPKEVDLEDVPDEDDKEEYEESPEEEEDDDEEEIDDSE
jgi:hypothetical protein